MMMVSYTADAQVVDFLQSTGKIYAVITAIVVIFLLIVLYLVRLDNKISKLEKQINNEQ
jgi:CcmD family protein